MTTCKIFHLSILQFIIILEFQLVNLKYYIEIVPEFEPFKRNGKRQDTLSSEELLKLFPYDEKELIEIWKRPDDMRKEQPEIALMFGTLFCVTVSAGLRSCEIRALHRDQISIDNSGLIIDRAIDDLGHIGLLKKATEEDPRSRAVIIPEITSYNAETLA